MASRVRAPLTLSKAGGFPDKVGGKPLCSHVPASDSLEIKRKRILRGKLLSQYRCAQCQRPPSLIVHGVLAFSVSQHLWMIPRPQGGVAAIPCFGTILSLNWPGPARYQGKGPFVFGSGGGRTKSLSWVSRISPVRAVSADWYYLLPGQTFHQPVF